jgi:NADP-dependent 3-hydroxy acid dehydrogenase YdfG
MQQILKTFEPMRSANECEPGESLKEIALITGGNSGIGLATAKAICQ